ncbi:MAG: hypothetical protein LAN71_02450 [Acidobacteriia bacterium]|nr:hypothetical protein [Terriglobia bacterium]
MRRWPLLSLCALLLGLAPAAVSQRPSPAQTIPALQSRFDAETNSVRKAKLLAKLGDAQFIESRRAGKAQDYPAAQLILEKYRDNVRAAIAEVIRQHPNAEKESSGYRIIELHVRAGIRETIDAMNAAPLEFRPPLQVLRDDLQRSQDQLLRLLFPRRPGEKRPPAAPPQGAQ